MLIPTTYVSTSVSTVPVTVQTTVTQTSVFVAGLPIATTLPYTVLEVSFDQNPSAQLSSSKNIAVQPNAASKRAADFFCTNYYDACSRQCARVYSTPSKQVCKRTSTTAFSYQLVCLCKNGYTETRHSLADLQKSLTVASTIAFATTTQTLTQNQTKIVTLRNTTTLIMYTETTKSFTVTNTATSKVTSTSISKTTYSPGTTTTTTTSPLVATQTATSTTLQVLAPTGVIRARHVSDDSAIGYLTMDTSSTYNQLQVGTTDRNAAQRFMLVQNGALYTLVSATDPSQSVVCEWTGEGTTSPSFGSNVKSYCNPEVLSSNKGYGPASQDPAGLIFGGPIERSIWNPSVAAVNGLTTLKLFFNWINPNNTTPTTYLLHQGQDLIASSNKAYVGQVLGSGVDLSPLYLAIEPSPSA